MSAFLIPSHVPSLPLPAGISVSHPTYLPPTSWSLLLLPFLRLVLFLDGLRYGWAIVLLRLRPFTPATTIRPLAADVFRPR